MNRSTVLCAWVVVLCAGGWARTAYAQSPSPSPDASEAAACETARCLERGEEGEEPLLWVPRVVLRVPRLAFDAASRLIVLGARLEDEHHVAHDTEEVFFDDANKFGVYPTAFYETGFKASIGVRLVHRDLFSQREALRMRALYGGIHQQMYEMRVHSGQRFGRLRLVSVTSYKRVDNLPFYGLGNADEVPPNDLDVPYSAFARDVAFAAEYRSAELLTSVAAEVTVARKLWLTASQQLRRRRLSTGEDRGIESEDPSPWVTEIYTPETLVGLGDDQYDSYTELILTWDQRRRRSREVPRALPAEGFRLATWAGAQMQLASPHRPFARLGVDAQRFIDLFHGDRVLRLRLRTAWSIGELDEISFVDLPALGGSRFLRGYATHRFRDRGSLLGTVEYRYPVQENFAGYVFVDAGRVANNLDDLSLAGLRESRVGFGVGLVAFSASSILFRAQLTTSVDGGWFLHLLLDSSDALGPNY